MNAVSADECGCGNVFLYGQSGRTETNLAGGLCGGTEVRIAGGPSERWRKVNTALVNPTFKGGYKLERNFVKKCGEWTVPLYSTGALSIMFETFLSYKRHSYIPLTQNAEKLTLFARPLERGVNIGIGALIPN